MKVALATSQGRMVPCFAGVELWIVKENADVNKAEVFSTHGWHPLAWGSGIDATRHRVVVVRGNQPGNMERHSGTRYSSDSECYGIARHGFSRMAQRTVNVTKVVARISGGM